MKEGIRASMTKGLHQRRPCGRAARRQGPPGSHGEAGAATRMQRPRIPGQAAARPAAIDPSPELRIPRPSSPPTSQIPEGNQPLPRRPLRGSNSKPGAMPAAAARTSGRDGPWPERPGWCPSAFAFRAPGHRTVGGNRLTPTLVATASRHPVLLSRLLMAGQRITGLSPNPTSSHPAIGSGRRPSRRQGVHEP